MEEHSSAHRARRILIGRIETLAIGQMDAALSFEGRLAAENGWTDAFAVRVAAEYRRFLVLIALGEEELTPSDSVDQAWHLHMVYTRDYWRGLCRDIVGRDLHHEPTSGGQERRDHYRSRYARTLQLYQVTFRAAPPADIWPEPSARFAGRFQRVDLSRAALFGATQARWAGCLCAGLAILAAVGESGPLLILLMVAAVVMLAMANNLKAGTHRRTRTSVSAGEGCAADAGCGGGDGGGDSGCGGGCGGGCG